MKITAIQKAGYLLTGSQSGNVLSKMWLAALYLRDSRPDFARELTQLHDEIDALTPEIYYQQTQPTLELDIDEEGQL